MSDPAALPIVEFAFPGPLRDRLVAAILEGVKTTTSSTLIEYSIEDEALPAIGNRQVVVNSAAGPIAVIETTNVRIVRLADVDEAHAFAEGEGYASLDEWRSGHERFWHSDEMRDYLQDPDFSVNDETQIVLERFKLVKILA